MPDDNDKLKSGKKELEILMLMFERWVKSDFDWALEIINTQGCTGEEGEWDFLRRDWVDKLENWMSPFLFRLYRTGYITEDDLRKFGADAYDFISLMLTALYVLSGGTKKNE